MFSARSGSVLEPLPEDDTIATPTPYNMTFGSKASVVPPREDPASVTYTSKVGFLATVR